MDGQCDTSIPPVSKPQKAGLKNRYFVAGYWILKKKKKREDMKSTRASMLRGIVIVISFLYKENECAVIGLMQRGMELIPPRDIF